MNPLKITVTAVCLASSSAFAGPFILAGTDADDHGFVAAGANQDGWLFMQRALEKRPVSIERLEAAIAHIKHKLRATGEREIKSLVLGELVMAELQKLDEVAYIRFASVYKRFQDLNEFREEIDRLSREPAKG